MKLKLVLSVVLGVGFSAVAAQAHNNWHLYGAVPVAGDTVLEAAYRAALDHCSYEGYYGHQRVGFYGGDYGSAEIRRCMSRKGFILQDGQPHAYPASKAAYHVR
jgi:hypothetical protein